MIHCMYLGVSVYNLHKILYFCLKIVLTLTTSVDPDETSHYVVFHLGLHCLQKVLFRGFKYTKG